MAEAPPPGSPPAERVPFLRRLPPIPFAFFALALVFVLYQLVWGVITLFLSGGGVSAGNLNLVRWSTFVGQIVFIMVPTLLLARARHGALVSFFRLRVPELGELVSTMVAVFALQQILQTYMLLQDSIPLPSEVQKAVEVFKKVMEEMYRGLVTADTPGEFLVVVLIVALTPAIAEELLFRGLVQRNFEEGAGGLRGAIIAGLIFGAYHLNPFSLVPLMVLGAYFGFIVFRSENITLAMSAHFFNNFVACAAVYLQLDDNFLAIAPSSRPGNTLLALNFLVFALVFVASTLYFIHITDRDGNDKEELF